jgi:hypothetical protein
MITRHKDSQETDVEATRSGDCAGTLRLREVEKAAVVSRRGVLWRMGLATVGGVGALTALSERRAEAATLGNFILGATNDAGLTTSLVPTSATSSNPLMMVDGTALNATATTLIVKGPLGGAAFSAQGFSSNATVATIGLAINGAGSGTARGIYGSSGSNTGVQGASTSGVGVVGTSSSSTGVSGASTSGAGVTGSSSTGSGVSGTSTSGLGASGVSGSGVGARGKSNTSTGVLGSSGSSPTAKPKTWVYGYAAQDNFSRGVTGESPAGIGLYGISTTGYGVYSAGRVYTSTFYEAGEITTPAAPIANRARIFARDDGFGKTQLCVRFNTGAVQVIKTQP